MTHAQRRKAFVRLVEMPAHALAIRRRHTRPNRARRAGALGIREPRRAEGRDIQLLRRDHLRDAHIRRPPPFAESQACARFDDPLRILHRIADAHHDRRARAHPRRERQRGAVPTWYLS